MIFNNKLLYMISLYYKKIYDKFIDFYNNYLKNYIKVIC